MRRAPFDFADREPGAAPAGRHTNGVRAQGGDGGVMITDLTSPEAVEYLRGGASSTAGAVVNVHTALKVATAWRCLHLIAGVCGNVPMDVMRKVSERERQPATGHPLATLLTGRPNGWQTRAEFRKMLTAHAVMKGNAYALKVKSRGRLLALWPIHNPDAVAVRQNADMTMAYTYTRRDGSQIPLTGDDLLHLRGLTWDGITGVGVLRYARESLGFSLQLEQAGARMFRQGAIGSPIFTKEGVLGDVAFARLKEQLDETGAGAENAHKALILEDGLKQDGQLMSADDLQFLSTREFQRADIPIFFGVPPHMVGIVDKTTSWGSGIEQQSIGFSQYSAEDWWTMWEQSLERDCLDPVADPGIYVRINRTAILRGDTKARWEAYTRALQWGVNSPNEIRANEDQNPREGGDVFYDPPNTPGDKGSDEVTLEPPPAPADA